jgi:hypothetical protein
MLALTEDGIHDVMWSDDLLDEWERVIVRERRRSPDAAAAIAATIRPFFADTRIRFASVIPSDPSNRTARIILSTWKEHFGQARKRHASLRRMRQ